jgi:hypothetical protein
MDLSSGRISLLYARRSVVGGVVGAINDDREEVEPGGEANRYPRFSSDEPYETTHELDAP